MTFETTGLVAELLDAKRSGGEEPTLVSISEPVHHEISREWQEWAYRPFGYRPEAFYGVPLEITDEAVWRVEVK